jgi:hypothetical protein
VSQHAQSDGDLRWRIEMGTRGLARRWPWPMVLAWGAAVVGIVVVAMGQSPKPFYNDSSEYWSLAATFVKAGHFSLLNFSNPERGYLLPLVSHGLQTLQADLDWTASSMAKVFNAVIFALIGTVLGPALMQTVWPEQPTWGIARRLTLAALLVVFWSGYLNFPLSDFPGLAAALLALVAVARTDRPGWMLAAGAAVGMAINVRAAYIPFAPVVAGLVVWAWIDQRGTRHASARHRALCAGLLVLGFATVSLPQSLAAHRHHGTWSFLPDAASVEPVGMFLTPGMEIQGRDTYVGSGRSILMAYDYPAGQRLLAEQKNDRISSTSQYLGLFVSHPLVMGGLILGHVVNAMDPLYSTPYIENLDNGLQNWRRAAGFLLVFLALLRVLWPAARRRLGPGRLRYLAALAVCCVTTIPSPIERRYMLSLYLLSYAMVLMPGWPNPIRSGHGGLRRFQTAAAIGVAFAVFSGVVWYITGDAIGHLRFS